MAEATATDSASPQEVPSRRTQLGFVAAVFGMFMAILDIQIVASSLNEIQAGVSASADEISWVQTSYLIAEIIMIPLSGMLTRILSTRVAFVVSCLGFTLASLGCAMANSIEALIVLRAIQGFMGGAMIPIAYAISFSVFPRRMMGSVQAVMGLVATLAPSIGPTVGGYITEFASWHWLFLANLVPGVLVSVAVWRLLDIDRPDHRALRHLDLIGLALLALFLGTLEFSLEEGPGEDWFASRTILIAALVCALTSVGFFWRTLRHRHPIVDLRAFANLNFAVGACLGFVVGIGLYGLVYLLPLFLGNVRGYSALQIGEVMIVTGMAMFMTAPLVGRASDKVDLRILLLLGMLLTGIGTVMNANLTAEAGFDAFFWPQVVRGMGLVMCLIPTSRIAFGTLPPSEVGNASGLFNVMRNLGGAVGLALLDTIRDWREDYHWNQLIPAIDNGREVVNATQAQYQQLLASTGDPQTAAVEMMARTLLEQAMVMAYNDIFLWLGMLYLLVAPLILLLKKPQHA
ncbi:DHA2 family multidrug resistance protein [Chromohalobacter marismortui]|uniref:DHA2 family multidrug resistance protein n=1 Tax=Chromohalobacter marismortui TaxID=42055 RepID=A0A4R7NSP5_9GAMM|nr:MULTISPECIES: DHA2 family efflux MFS transporter permease subunit [Chromohalobacter]MCI0509035.1 DHA2 family efflux MFS transporter permease subunit [Chromohalobacter sp.]MCI0592860.1 DHA2 family efflux MFS transporter permease subunit [Chromohalobacter sp.]TDU24075.1 DHA2 family multidrug resistance protein [Chromohalobacter marismortui]